MFGTHPVPQPVPPAARRVRHGVRDGVAVMMFSAATSAGLAAVFLLLSRFAAGFGN